MSDMIELEDGRTVDTTILEIWALNPTHPFNVEGGIPVEWDRETVREAVDTYG